MIDLSDEEKAAMGDDWSSIGYDTSEQLAIIPRQYYVIAYKRAKYVPKHDEVAGAEQGVRIAPRPDQIIPKSLAHSSLIAHVVVRKFVDGLPFYRQEAIHAREGIDLSRQTMSGWVMQLDQRLSPLMAAMKRLLYEGRVIQIDETRLQVLNEPGRDNTQLSYMWVYGGGPPDRPVIWYQYADSRGGDVPLEFLYPQEGDSPDGAMYLVTDGYEGYNALSKTPGILAPCACWAHYLERGFMWSLGMAARLIPGIRSSNSPHKSASVIKTAGRQASLALASNSCCLWPRYRRFSRMPAWPRVLVLG